MVWPFKRRMPLLPPPDWNTPFELGVALQDLFRTYGKHPDGGRQQVCLHCRARGGFEMQHGDGCIVDVAARHLMCLPNSHNPISHGQAPCQDCRTQNPVWFAPNTLWNLVMGGPAAKDDPGGIVCPNCFIKRAEAAGQKPTAWVLQPEQLT